jgi:hypothetical protein
VRIDSIYSGKKMTLEHSWEGPVYTGVYSGEYGVYNGVYAGAELALSSDYYGRT